MSKRQVFHVVPAKGRWNVNRAGAEWPEKTFIKKKDAVNFGREIAKSHRPGQLRIHKKDGTIQEERTYGKDPYLPKG
jgi:hypothetical protein